MVALGAFWGLTVLTCRPDRATCRAQGTHPRLLRTVPCRARKGLMGSVMHNLLAIEPLYSGLVMVPAGMSSLRVCVLPIGPALWMLL